MGQFSIQDMFWVQFLAVFNLIQNLRWNTKFWFGAIWLVELFSIFSFKNILKRLATFKFHQNIFEHRNFRTRNTPSIKSAFPTRILRWWWFTLQCVAARRRIDNLSGFCWWQDGIRSASSFIKVVILFRLLRSISLWFSFANLGHCKNVY